MTYGAWLAAPDFSQLVLGCTSRLALEACPSDTVSMFSAAELRLAVGAVGGGHSLPPARLHGRVVIM